MKIVNRAEFLKMPAGTVYSEYEPCVFGDIQIKGDTIGNDFWTQNISSAVDANDSGEFADILFDAEENNNSFDIDLYVESRDGMFEEKQLFSVWDAEDVFLLIERFKQALVEGYR